VPRALFGLLNVIRVYTKAPGQRADRAVPFVLPNGATVQDVSAAVHKDFAERLKYARIWGAQTFEGQMVQREHVLADGDLLELHT
jgi:ribosome-interacting GTPase 1